MTVLSKNKIIVFKNPGEISEDPLTELLRNGARKLITDAVEVELQQLEQYVSAHSDALFSHGLCEECAKKHYGEFLD